MLESELEKHKLKCPGYRRLQAEQAQPFYSQGINGGPGEEVQWPAHVTAAVAAEAAAAEAAAAAAAAAGEAPRRRRGRGPQGPAAFQAAYAAALGEQGFAELLRRIEAACEQVRGRGLHAAGCACSCSCLLGCRPALLLQCAQLVALWLIVVTWLQAVHSPTNAPPGPPSTLPQICEPEPLSLLVPPEAEPFLVPESATCNRPFSLKHAQQQVGSSCGHRGVAGSVSFLDRPPATTPSCSRTRSSRRALGSGAGHALLGPLLRTPGPPAFPGAQQSGAPARPLHTKLFSDKKICYVSAGLYRGQHEAPRAAGRRGADDVH